MSTSTPSLAACLNRIRAFAAARTWPAARLAREAGISEVVTRDMASDQWSPTASSIRKLEALIPVAWMPGQPLPAEQPHTERPPGAGTESVPAPGTKRDSAASAAPPGAARAA